MTSPSSYQRFFAELKRRRVFRVMAVYGIVGFVVLQVVDLAVPALLLPEWTYRLAALFLLLGFPVAIVLAWAFEVTPEGVRRTSDPDAGEIDAIAAAPRGQRWPVGLAAAAGTALLVGGAWWVLDGPGTGAARAVIGPDDPVESIAVLPFADLSPEGDQAYFGDGLAEELLDALAQVEGLTVAARTSAFRFRGAEVDMREVADQLSVQTVLEGSVRRGGDRVRITAQLVNADGHNLWSGRYDRSVAEMEDLIGVQEEIARSIVEALSLDPEATDGGEPLETLVAQGTDNLEAYNAFLRGRQLMAQRTPQGLAAAAEQFELAVALDPTYVRAWANLGMTHNLRVGWGFSTDSAVIQRGREATDRALELDPRSAEAHTSRGYIHVWIDPDSAAAQRAFARAIELNPKYPTAWHWRGEMLSDWGHPDAGIPYLETARDLDPLSPIILTDLAAAYDEGGRYGEADSLVARLLELEPEFLPAWLMRADFRIRNGEPLGRIRDFEHVRSFNPDLSWIDLEIASSYAAAGDFRSAVETFRQEMPADISDIPGDLQIGLFIALPWLMPAILEAEGPDGIRTFTDRYLPLISEVGQTTESLVDMGTNLPAVFVRGFAAGAAGDTAQALLAVDQLYDDATEMRAAEAEGPRDRFLAAWAFLYSMSLAAAVGDVERTLAAFDAAAELASRRSPYERFWLEHGAAMRSVRDDPRVQAQLDELPPYTDFDWPDP